MTRGSFACAVTPPMVHRSVLPLALRMNANPEANLGSVLGGPGSQHARRSTGSRDSPGQRARDNRALGTFAVPFAAVKLPPLHTLHEVIITCEGR